MANTIILEQTCGCCPEQYWAYKGSHIIGYIRLRWGHLTCDYLPKGKLTDNDIRVYDKTFNERTNDNFKGSFDTEEEREYWLNKCKEALLNKYNELKNK
jgi:hypothetical protein